MADVNLLAGTLLMLVHLVTVIRATPSGPPSAACSNQIPQHFGTPQTSGSPYRITVNPATYGSGTTVQGKWVHGKWVHGKWVFGLYLLHVVTSRQVTSR